MAKTVKTSNYYEALRDLEDSYFPEKYHDELEEFYSEHNIEGWLRDFIDPDSSKGGYPPLIPCYGRKILFDLPPANDKGEIIIEIELCGL